MKKDSIPLSCCNQDVMSNSTCPEVFNQGCKQPLVRYIQMLMVEATISGFILGSAQVKSYDYLCACRLSKNCCRLLEWFCFIISTDL